MTAEIAILNKHAVALAADSAVTVGPEKKVFTSVNKIFTLSKYRPIGIMIYASASFMDIPWETLIKIYRDKLGTFSFDTLEEASGNFIAHLEGLRFDESLQRTIVTQSIHESISLLLDKFQGECHFLRRVKDKPTEDDFDDVLKKIVEYDFKQAASSKEIKFASLVSHDEFVKRYDDILKNIFERSFEGSTNIVDDFFSEFCTFCYNLFATDYNISQYTGIVITGYGENETFPCLYGYRIKGVVADTLSYYRSNVVNISNSNTSNITPFAQREMVHLFMEGIDPSFEFANVSFIESFFEEYNKTIIDDFTFESPAKKEFAHAKLKSKAAQIIDEYKNQIKKYKWQQFISPILEIVAILPKPELAQMAEALVNLTTIKRKMSFDAESVGGPTDVAVISKGDGFIWIKRKHYFDPHLNHHFFKNYFGD